MTLALPDTLQRSRDLVVPALRTAVHRLDPSSRAVASYHLGWTDADGRPSGGGGKAVRPALALLSAAAAGADETTGVPGAVAVELVHNFSLLHDDLVDGDTERRHRPTAWTLRGPAAAILTGDAMLALAQQVLLDVGSRSAVDAARLLGDATQELIRGQFDDLAFERRDDVTVEQCLAMAAGKTGALLAASAAIGAVLAGAPAATVAALWTYGAELGLAFQLVDDVLGIWGDPKVTGKPVGSDLRARKKSLPVTWALAEGGVAGAELREWLAVANSDDDAAVAHATGLVDRAGARQWAQQQASDHLRLADAALDTAGVPAAVRAELVAVGRFVVERQG